MIFIGKIDILKVQRGNDDDNGPSGVVWALGVCFFFFNSCFFDTNR
jgi:hypothetical protein